MARRLLTALLGDFMAADRITPFPTQTLNRFQSDVEQLIEGYSFRELGQQIEEFGRKSPLALVFAALTVGFAAGMLLRRNISPEGS